MSEMVKTLIFAGVALLSLAIAFFARPSSVGDSPAEIVGRPLFEKFTDPLAVKSLTINYVSEEGDDSMSLTEAIAGRDAVQTFEVAQKKGTWVIPSHRDYPADAEDKIGEAGSELVDLEVLSIASEVAADHELYGVVDPDPENVESGQKGVGKKIVMKDGNGKELAELVIGKGVKGSDGQRFVRVPGQTPVYVVEIDPDSFSTRFEDWIETDVLQLNSMDITDVTFKDYSVLTQPTGRGGLAIVGHDQRLEAKLKWNDSDFKWELMELRDNVDGKLVSAELAEGEELDDDNLREMKNALDDLKIVDVERKPKGLGADLKADKGFMQSDEGVQSLISRGYYPVEITSGKLELLCSDGEIQVVTKEGVKYLLRFGEIAGMAGGEGEEGKLNRYLMVSAQVDESQFPMPEMPKMPEARQRDPLPVDPTEKASGPGEAESNAPRDQTDGTAVDESDTTPADTTPAKSSVATEGDGVNGGEADNSGGTENTTPSGEPAGEALPDDAAAGVETEQIQTELVDEVVEAAGEGDVAEPDATATEPATDTPETNEDPAGSAEETDAAATGSTADGEEVEVDEVEIKDQFDLAAEREKLMKEYQRKLDGWKADRKKAEDKVKELNFRFADWYYVISEDEYKKIHLGRKELIKIDEEALKEKEEQEAAEGDDIDAFRELEQPLE